MKGHAAGPAGGGEKPKAHDPPKPSPESHKAPPHGAAPPGAPAGEPAAPPRPEELLASKTKECRELVDQLQRLAAEYSNYQKRAQKRIEEEQRLAVRDLVLDLLPALDNFERALTAAQTTPDFNVLLDGVRLAHDQMVAGLKKHGITPIETRDAAFDPEHHEAVTCVPSPEHPEGRIVQEMQKGYRIDGRTLRASRVAVSKGPPAAGGGEGEQAKPEREDNNANV